MKTTRNKQLGFTLIEVIMVMVIFAVVSIIPAMLLHRSALATNTGYDVGSTVAQGENAQARMTHELRNIRSPSDITSAGANSITFVDVSGRTITFDQSGSNLQRTIASTTTTLAQNLVASSLDFAYLDSTGTPTATAADIRYVEFDFTISNGTISEEFNNVIMLRNTS